jgi:hypothetical protein
LPAPPRPEIAAKQFVDHLNAVAGCVTERRLVVFSPPSASTGPVTARFLDPASLRSPAGGPSGLLVDIAIVFVIVPAEPVSRSRRWDVRTAMYEYRLLDHDHTELLVYHWQPGAAYAGPDEPHLHVSATLNARIDAVSTRSIDLDKLHIATGLVSLAAVVRMLIAEFGIAPQRADWRETLERAAPAS